MREKHVRILATGGTIAGKSLFPGGGGEYESGVVAVDELLAATPGLEDVADISWRRVAAVGSEDMTEEVWRALAEAVDECMSDAAVDGVVVLHGTDTMEESAYLLHLLSRGGKPVVFTGAMRPGDAVSADGPGNILGAVRLAAAGGNVGVVVLAGGTIFAAREVTKADTLSCDAFASPNAGPLGRIIGGRVVLWRGAAALGAGEFAGGLVVPLPRVEIVYGHACMGPELIDALTASGVEGLVYAGVGRGNIHAGVRPALVGAAAAGVAVVCSSRAERGIVSSGRRDGGDWFISAGDLNPQKARVLLQLALWRDSGFSAIRDVFERCSLG